MTDGTYLYFTEQFTHDFDGLMILSDAQRLLILESIRQQLKITPGYEKMWEELELPLVRRLCADLKIKCLPSGVVNLYVSDSTLVSTLNLYTMGSSWFSAVNLVGAVAYAMSAVK